MGRKNRHPGQAPASKIPCLECGRLLGQISESHLRKHGLTTAEYKKKHNTEEVMAPGVRARISRKHRDARRSEKDLDAYVPRTSRQILEELASLILADPQLTHAELKRSHPSFERQIVHVFGSFCEAVSRTGLDRRRRRTWTKETVTAEIRKIHEAGRSLRENHVRKRRGSSVIHAARRQFGGWRDAVKAAGLDPDELCPLPKRRTRKTVGRDLKAWSSVHGPLIARDLQRTDYALHLAATRIYGSLKDAADALGLEWKSAWESRPR